MSCSKLDSNSCASQAARSSQRHWVQYVMVMLGLLMEVMVATIAISAKAMKAAMPR